MLSVILSKEVAVMSEHRRDTEQHPPEARSRAWSANLGAIAALVVLVDDHGRIVEVNEAFAESVGAPPPDLKGRELWTLLDDRHAGHIKRLFTAADPTTDGSRILVPAQPHESGHQRPPIVWSFSTLGTRSRPGRLLLAVGLEIGSHTLSDLICPDDSLEIRQEAASLDRGSAPVPEHREEPLSSDGPLHQSAAGHGSWFEPSTEINDLVRPLLEHTSDIITVLTADGEFVYVSPSVQRVLGHEPSRLLRHNAFDLVHPDDLGMLGPRIAQGLDQPGTPQQVECRVRHADGSWRIVEARGVAHREGEMALVILNITDISQRRRAEDALAESEERFRSAFENTAMAKVLWAPDGTVVRVNRAVCDILGFDEAEMLRLSWREQVHPEDLASLTPRISDLLAGMIQSVRADVRVRHRDGPWIWGRATLSVSRDTAGQPQCIIGELEDITENRMIEEEKRARLNRVQGQQSAIVAMASNSALVHGNRDEAFQAITEVSAGALDVERVGIWMLSDDRSELRCVDLYESSSKSHSAGQLLDAGRYPHYFDALESGRVVDADDAVNDPRTSEYSTEYLEPLGITSMLDAPIRLAGEVVGVVCHEHVGQPRLWQSDEVTFAGEVADQAAHALVSAHRKRAELRLQVSEERFRSIVNSSPMGLHMYRLEADGRLVFTGSNPAADTILGVDCRGFIGKSIEEAFPPLAKTEVPERYREAASRGTPWHVEQIEYQDELIRGAYEVHAFQTAPNTVTVMFLDITDRKRAEEALRTSEERYRQLFERNLAAVYRSTIDGRILDCNEAFADMLGCGSRSDALSRTASDFYPSAADRSTVVEELRASREIRNRETALVRSDGQPIWVLANMSLVNDRNGQAGIIEGTMIDITQRKRMEEQLLQAQKMEAVGRLAGGVAHDFNNLLQAMLGVTELLRNHGVKADTTASRHEELEELILRGSQLTRQLLLFSRRDTARQEELELNQVVQGTVRLLRRLLRENIELRFEPTVDHLPLIADPGQIEQVVMNLAVNACDAMPSGGQLALSTGLAGGSAWLEVADTGEGIPEEIRDQLFEPFFTTKERGKGTGLGLSVVQGIVSRLGGTIDLESTVGEGTTVRVTFPITPPTGHIMRPVGEFEGIKGGHGECVLVVEDDAAVRDSLEEILGVLGYQVTTASCREEAWSACAQSDFDLLLSDYVLPDGSGTEIADELRERWPGLRVVLMSGYAQDEDVSQRAASGDLVFLQKPFSANALGETVRTALDGRAVPDDSVPAPE
jgi:PAS domain S-box-containing protein